MIGLIQRVSQASVSIAGQIHSHIDTGFLVLLGIEQGDTEDDVVWLSSKIVNLRIFSDQQGKMNHNIKDIDGNILLVSQFTLHASTAKGNRPSFIQAARPEQAILLYEQMIQQLSHDMGRQIQTGVFGADMQVSLINDGPVTISIDTKRRV